MTELEKIANRSWEENNTISIEADNEDAYKAGYIAGYNEAKDMNVPTKWHKVADGDLPKEKGVYLTYRKNGIQLLVFDGSYWVTGVQDDVHNTIIAWKEIIPPEINV